MKRTYILIYSLVVAVMLLASCASTHENATKVDKLPPIYPDYTNVTIPVNIAPLNFLMHNKHITGIEVSASIEENGTTADKGHGTTAKAENNILSAVSSDNTIQFGMGEWKDFLKKAVGKKVKVQVYTKADDGGWRLS